VRSHSAGKLCTVRSGAYCRGGSSRWYRAFGVTGALHQTNNGPDGPDSPVPQSRHRQPLRLPECCTKAVGDCGKLVDQGQNVPTPWPHGGRKRRVIVLVLPKVVEPYDFASTAGEAPATPFVFPTEHDGRSWRERTDLHVRLAGQI
jgi:hypothetical protein